MESWLTFGRQKELEEKKSSIFKDYIVPTGSLLIPILTLFTQNNLPFWVSVAIVIFVLMVFLFLGVPAIIRGTKSWTAYSRRVKLEGECLPKITASLRRFGPLMEPNHSNNIWGVWSNASRTAEMQKIVRPNYSHYYTLLAWLNHLLPTIDSGKSTDFKQISSEASSWVQQYVSFCGDAYSQFEELLRSGQLNESQVREAKQNWNHSRDEHNQAVSNWKALCSEINTSFDQKICSPHYETLKTLE